MSDQNVLRRAMLAAVTVLTLFFGSCDLLSADQTPELRKLASDLKREFGLTPTDIVKALWFTKPEAQLGLEPRLARWSEQEIQVSILRIGDVGSAAETLKAGISRVAALAHRHVSYCEDALLIGADDSYVLAAGRSECLGGDRRVTVVLDRAAEISRSVFRYLSDMSQSEQEKRFWSDRANADEEFYSRSRCGAHLTIESLAGSVVSGAANAKLGPPESVSEKCLEQLPYWLFAQKPIRPSSGLPKFVDELVQMSYSPGLDAGMTMQEVLRAVSQ